MKPFFSVLLVCAFITGYSQQLPNPSFEHWTDGHPDDWGTIDKALLDAGWSSAGCISQTSPGSDGSFAISLTTQDISINGWDTTLPGLIAGSEIVFDTTTRTYSIQPFPIDYRPTGLSLTYKFAPVSGDSVFIRCYMLKWNTSTNQRDTIGGFFAINTLPKPNFTTINLPINYNTPGIPDSVELSLFSSFNSAHEGTTFIVDQIGLHPYLAGMDGDQELHMKIFPNPATEYIRIEPSNDYSIIRAELINLLGQSWILENVNNTLWDISHLSPGSYIIKIYTNQHKQLYSQLIIK